MPKANDTDIYKYDLSISLMDYLFGSDADNGKKNKSYRIKDIIQLINGVNGKNNLQYLYSDGNNPELTYYNPGVFFTDTNEADPLAFTKLIVNKSSLQPIDLTSLFQRLGELEDVVIKLDNPSDPNNFFNFKVISIEDHIEYFTFQVELFKDFYLGEFLNETIYSVYFDIKSATESDPLKLDKGGYEGTAQDLNNSIKNIAFPDDVLKTGEIVITGLNAFVSAGDFQWRLNQVDFLTAPEFSEDIDPATDGFNRTDILEGDNAGIIHLKKGTENEAAAPEPEVTTGRIRLAGIPIFGSTIGTPTLPVIGDKFIPKQEKQPFQVYNSGEINNTVLDDFFYGYLNFRDAVTNLKSIGTYTNAHLYSGRELLIKNSQATDITIYHLTGSGFQFSFPNEVNFILKPNEIIRFSTKILSPTSGILEYVGVVRDSYTKEESDMAMAIELQSRVYGDEHLQDQISYLSSSKVDKVAGKGLSTEDYTPSEKNKLASIDATHYLAPLQTTVQLSALPQAGISDKARVYVENDLSDYFYDATASSGDIAPDDQAGGIGFWRKVAVGGETAASIKTKYESNADTNAFTDTLKSKLDSITAIFTTALKSSYDGVVSGYTTLMATGSRLITTGEITKLENTSNTNTGDQDLSGLSLKPIQVTAQTLTMANWTLVSGYYEYNLANANITTTSIVDIIPDNASIPTIKTAEVLPKTLSGNGTVKMYSVKAPTGNIIVTLNIWK